MRKRESILDRLSIAAEQNIKERDYWQRQLTGEWDKTGIPYDFKESSPGEPGAGTGTVTFTITGDLYAKLIRLSNGSDHMLHMVLVAIWVVMLDKYNYNGNGDIIVGAPIYRQEDDSGDELINTVLPLRHGLTPGLTFKELLRQVRETIIQASDHYNYPMEILVEQLGLETAPEGGFPLFDVAILVESIHDKNYLKHIRSAITASFQVTGQCIEGNWEYDRALYGESTAASLCKHFMYLAAQALTDINREIRQLSLLDPAEKNRVLNELNDTARDYRIGPEDTIPRRFERQVERTPDKIALEYAGKEITYSQLNQRANQLAHYLKSIGVKPGVITGIMMNPGIEMMVGILGILKAGGAYLPIDTTYPQERILLILKENDISILLTDTGTADKYSYTALQYLRADGLAPYVTGLRQQSDFDSLPHPDRSLIDYEKYSGYIGHAMVKKAISLQATRGCPYNCAYCHRTMLKKNVARSAENVFSEVKYYYDRGVRRFSFVDEIFNLNTENSTEFFKMVIKNRLEVQLFFPNGMRADRMTRDYVDLMVEAGTVNLGLALETASPRLQKLIKKNMNIDKLREIARYFCDRYPGVILELFTMHGFPTETQEEAMETLNFIKKLKWVHFPYVFLLKIHPSTEMMKLALDSGVSRAAIEKSMTAAFHEIPETLPFPKGFTRQYVAQFMNDYFLCKERLLHVLPYQLKIASENELARKYDNYLPARIRTFPDLLENVGISREELGELEFVRPDTDFIPDYAAIRQSKYSPWNPYPFSSPVKPTEKTMRILLLDLSVLFTTEKKDVLHGEVTEPLGLMYLLTYLAKTFGSKINGRMYKAQIDFDSYEELKPLVCDFKPHLIGIRTLSYFKDFFHKTVALIKEWGIEGAIIAGGPYGTSDYKFVLQDPAVDLTVLREGELTLAELVEKMMAHGNKLPGEEELREIPGIAFLSTGDKKRLQTMSRQVLAMDKLAAAVARYPLENPGPINRPHDLVYLISTSGSTGKPKSVMIEHWNMMNLLHFELSDQGVDFCRDILQFASIGFDVSAQEIFSALLCGGKLWLMDRELKGDILQLFEFIRGNNISIVFWPPAFLKLIFSESMYINAFPRTITHIIAAGEQLIVPRALKEYIKAHRVYLLNHYGPSETHVVTSLTLGATGEIPGRPSIGKPIANTAIYILDKSRDLQPIGIAGELCIGGNNVGRGYLNRPELTAQKFIFNHLTLVNGESKRSRKTSDQCPINHDRIYLTGDLARWQPDGNIEFIGRIDYQVKIRGFRVELGEIEKQLVGIRYIKEAVVLERGTETRQGKNYLCAYVVAEIQVEVTELREILARSLSDFMIPSYFVQIESIPLTVNGKLYRKALPDPETAFLGKTRAAPENEIEAKLTDVWADVLGIEKDDISVTDNFFELGGHSLKATIMAAKIHKIFNVKITLGEMFRQPFIRGLAKHINTMVKEKFSPLQITEKKEYYTLSSAQQRFYVLQQMDPGTIGYNMPEAVLLAGALNKNKMESVFRTLIQRHGSLRTSFEMADNEPVQRIHKEIEFKIEYYNLTTDNENYKPQITNKKETKGHHSSKNRIIHHSFVVRPFDLSHAPLFRVGLIKLEEEKHILVIDMHHIISDGMSHQVFEQEFMALYAHETLPSLRLQYKDYSQWQSSETQKRAVKNQESFWLKQFDGGIPALELFIDYPRPRERSYEGSKYSFEMDAAQVQALKALAREENSTLFMVLLAITTILLSKITGKEDIVIGTPAVGRSHADLERIIGVFINTLALRNYPAPGKNAREFLQEVRQNTLSAFENQDYPFEDLVEKVAPGKENSRNPLFDVMFTVHQRKKYPGEIRQPGGTNLKMKPYGRGFILSQFDLIFYVEEVESEVLFTLLYSKMLFKPDTIQRFTRYYKEITAALVENPDILLKDINVSYDLSRQKIAIPPTEFGF